MAVVFNEKVLFCTKIGELMGNEKPLLFETKIEHFDNAVYGAFVRLSKSQVSQVLGTEPVNKRVVCTLDNTLTYPCAIMPMGNTYFFVMVNKTNLKKIGKKVDDIVEVQLVKDHSKYGLEMPEAFEMILEQDEVGKKWFSELTPGKQRSLIYIVLKIKNVDLQIQKSIVILQHLTKNRGKLDYKELNDDFRRAKELGI